MDTQTSTPAILTWTDFERPIFKRSKRWYLIAGSFVVVCGIGSIFSGAWSFSIVLVLTSGLYFVLHKVPPRTLTVAIFPGGFTVNGVLTPWHSCTGFWIYRDSTGTALFIGRQPGTNSDFRVQIDSISVDDVHAAIAPFLPYVTDRREKILDAIIRFCKL